MRGELLSILPGPGGSGAVLESRYYNPLGRLHDPPDFHKVPGWEPLQRAHPEVVDLSLMEVGREVPSEPDGAHDRKDGSPDGDGCGPLRGPPLAESAAPSGSARTTKEEFVVTAVLGIDRGVSRVVPPAIPAPHPKRAVVLGLFIFRMCHSLGGVFTPKFPDPAV